MRPLYTTERIVAALCLVMVSATSVPAQRAVSTIRESPTSSAAFLEAVQLFEAREPKAETTPASFIPLPSYGPWVGVTKWATLAAATGLGTLGFLLHAEANDTFDELTRRCNANPDICRQLNPDGSYADPELEALFQDAVDRDNQARVSLVAAEISFGLSVLLFIVDFERDRRPNNMPYDPEEEEQAKLDLELQPDRLTFRYYVN